MLMTNGIGATIGTIGAMMVCNHYVVGDTIVEKIDGWRTSWFIFAGYAFVVFVLFALIFHPKKTNV